MGGIVELPTYVVLPGPTGQTRTWGLFLDKEPGSVLPVGVHPVKWSLRTYEQITSGQMLLLVAPPRDFAGKRRPLGLRLELAISAYQQGPATAAVFAERMGSSYRPTYMALRSLVDQGFFVREQDGLWHIKAEPLPGSKAPTVIYTQALPPQTLVRALQKLTVQGQDALGQVVGQYDRMIIKQARTLEGHIRHISAVFTLEDAHAVGQDVVAKAAVKFASNSRPVCTFSRSVMDALRRDITRATNRAVGESVLMGECRAWLFNHPHVRTYEQALDNGLNERFTKGLFTRAMEMPRSVSLLENTLVTMDAQDGPEPLFAWESLVAWGEAVGVSAERVRQWAWWRGMLDGAVRTDPQIKQALGKDGLQRAKDTDRRMFAPFRQPGQKWKTDRDLIRAQAFRELVAEGGLVSPNHIHDIINGSRR